MTQAPKSQHWQGIHHENIRKGIRLRTTVTSTLNRARARAPKNVDVIFVRIRSRAKLVKLMGYG